MMADHIPFVLGSGEDRRLLKSVYSDSVMVRLSLQTCGRTLKAVAAGQKVWVDAGVDGLNKWRPKRITKGGDPTARYDAYDKYISRFPGHDRIGDGVFQSKPKGDVVGEFVEAVLDACCALSPKPAWVSVPQLPMVNDASRNRINRALARSAADWKSARKFSGKLILPVIFTHSKQVNLKTQRKGKLVNDCYDLSGADGVWAVDSTLNDHSGSGSLDKRFQGIIRFHQELAEALPSEAVKIAGPYWGINLILWARGLINYPAIGLGSAYQYHIPGPAPSPRKSRVALSPLRRMAFVPMELGRWLSDVLSKLPKADPLYSALGEVRRVLLQGEPLLRTQVAEHYKDWFDEIASVPPSGRSLALYQDLSKAFVFGRSLPPLPREEKTARRPERVAQQLMLNCL